MDKTEAKTVYAYDATGLYIGDKILDCTDRSPISGTWQIPANCTEIAPETKAGYDAYFASGAWTYIAQEIDVLCYYNNGMSHKSVPSTYKVSTGEVLFLTTPTDAELAAAFTGYIAALKVAKLTELDTAAAMAYTSGFSSAASGSAMWYDSDNENQAVINRLYTLALANSTTFAATVFMSGVTAGQAPIRAKVSQTADDSTKIIQYLTYDKIITLANDMQNDYTAKKASLWSLQDKVNACTTAVAIEVITW